MILKERLGSCIAGKRSIEIGLCKWVILSTDSEEMHPQKNFPKNHDYFMIFFFSLLGNECSGGVRRRR